MTWLCILPSGDQFSSHSNNNNNIHKIVSETRQHEGQGL